MKRKHSQFACLTAAAIAVVAASSFTSAQVVAPGFWYRGPVGYGAALYTGDPYFPYGYGFGGTSVIDSMNRGMADVIRAQGEAEQASAAAAVDREIARKQYLENKEQWLQIRRQQQRDNLARREETKARNNATRQRAQANRSKELPDRLSLDQFDPSTGKITWPTALAAAQFGEQRTRLDDLFATRAQAGNHSELANDAVATVREMQDVLRGRIQDMSADDYVAARKFLDGLAYEARVPSA